MEIVHTAEIDINPLKMETEMIKYIVDQNKAFFRSQQINDPDITDSEKKSIVQSVLNDNHKKFLFRFGNFIKEDHLVYFDNQQYNTNDEYEIRYFLAKLKSTIKNKRINVKNRRYAALQKMIEDDDYFSEKEMMCREPLLYDQLIGQYMTGMERKARDSLDSEVGFSEVLIEGIVRKHMEERRKQQELDEAEDALCEEIEETSIKDSKNKDDIHDERVFPHIPPSYRQHWGRFDDEPTSEGMSRLDSQQNYISASEKLLLKNEFYGIMYSNFISGKDKMFDYATVDDNPDYDNIEQQTRDEEEKYFDSDDGVDIDNSEVKNNCEKDNFSSEDELDVYIKQLSDNVK